MDISQQFVERVAPSGPIPEMVVRIEDRHHGHAANGDRRHVRAVVDGGDQRCLEQRALLG
jgi:hypothetical protein